MIAVAVVTLFPIVYDSVVEYSDTVTWYNYVPFKTITETLKNGITTTSVTQIIGNIILSVPFGIFVLLLFEIPQWWKKLLLALSFTLTIELLQMFIGLAIGNMYRNIDVDDIILNLLGTYLGYGLYRIIPNRVKSFFKL